MSKLAAETSLKIAKGRPRKNPVGENPKYICNICSRHCAKPSILRKHIRAHTNERPFPCDHCGTSFKTVSNLNKHQKSRSHRAVIQPIETQDSEARDSRDLSTEDHEHEAQYVEAILKLIYRDKPNPIQISYRLSYSQANDLVNNSLDHSKKNEFNNQNLIATLKNASMRNNRSSSSNPTKSNQKSQLSPFDERSAAETILTLQHGFPLNKSPLVNDFSVTMLCNQPSRCTLEFSPSSAFTPVNKDKETENTVELSMDAVKQMLQKKIKNDFENPPTAISSKYRRKTKKKECYKAKFMRSHSYPINGNSYNTNDDNNIKMEHKSSQLQLDSIKSSWQDLNESNNVTQVNTSFSHSNTNNQNNIDKNVLISSSNIESMPPKKRPYVALTPLTSAKKIQEIEIEVKKPTVSSDISKPQFQTSLVEMNNKSQSNVTQQPSLEMKNGFIFVRQPQTTATSVLLFPSTNLSTNSNNQPQGQIILLPSNSSLQLASVKNINNGFKPTKNDQERELEAVISSSNKNQLVYVNNNQSIMKIASPQSISPIVVNSSDSEGGKISNLRCHECDRPFKSKCDIKKHYKSKPHTDTIGFICDQTKNNNLQRLDEHSEPENLAKDKAKQIRSDDSEQIPKRSVEAFLLNDKKQCEKCQKLLEPSQYIAHMSVHQLKSSNNNQLSTEKSSDFGGRQFKCDICKIAYRTEGFLARHNKNKSHLKNVKMQL